MLVELSVMEQRYQAVLAVIQDGWKVTEVAARLGVSRQSVNNWILDDHVRLDVLALLGEDDVEPREHPKYRPDPARSTHQIRSIVPRSTARSPSSGRIRY